MGTVLYRTDKITFKTALEEAVENGVDLSHGDFRGQKLYGAKLDGIMAPGASLWGTDCRFIDMSGADLRNADMRNIDFKDACLAGSNFMDANFSGSYFMGTILQKTNLEGSIFTCPSLFGCDLAAASNLHRAIYCHRGEVNIALKTAPLVINGLSQRMVIFDDIILWGHELVEKHAANQAFNEAVERVKSTMARCL